MSKTMKIDSNQAFLLWKGEAKTVGKVRYTANERIEQIDLLCEIFYKYGIDFDEAMSYKRKIVEFMVTREGMKGNGKYKGWKEATEEDFISTLTKWYSGEFKIIKNNNSNLTKYNHYGTGDYIERNALIVAWTKYKFRSVWTESTCLEAHRVYSPLWNMFKKEVICSNWSKTGKRPKWAQNIY